MPMLLGRIKPGGPRWLARRGPRVPMHLSMSVVMRPMCITIRHLVLTQTLCITRRAYLATVAAGLRLPGDVARDVLDEVGRHLDETVAFGPWSGPSG